MTRFQHRITPALLAASALLAFPLRAEVPDNGGPWNVRVLEGGIGAERPLPEASPLLKTDARFGMAAWIRADRIQSGEAALIVIGFSFVPFSVSNIEPSKGVAIGST